MNDILSEHIELVKDQYRFHAERALVYSTNKIRSNKHLNTAERFEKLLGYLQSIQTKASDRSENKLFLTPEDIDGLPQELIDELSISDADKAEFRILEILEEHDGVMSLDQILVANYRKTNEIIKRSAMTNRLYRMSNKGLIESVPNKKGVYMLKNAQEELFQEDN